MQLIKIHRGYSLTLIYLFCFRIMNNYKFQNRKQFALKCNFCNKIGILTKYCQCRRKILETIQYKERCEPLRLDGSPAKLVVDIQIAADIFPASFDPLRSQGRVNQVVVNYLRLINRFPKIDNTIDVEFKYNNIRYFMNCIIETSSLTPITLGLPVLLEIGVRFSLGDTIIEQVMHSGINYQDTNRYSIKRNYNRVLNINSKYGNRFKNNKSVSNDKKYRPNKKNKSKPSMEKKNNKVDQPKIDQRAEETEEQLIDLHTDTELE